MYPKNELSQLLISAVHQFDIDTVVISPGSRNAPLTIGFSNHSAIKTFSIVDERCAAFFALGIAQQTQKPIALVCTSGSALLNYYPAIAEAFYSNIPLVIISADRPKHLIDIGDGQTIRQENVFENHILFSANLIENSELENQNLAGITKALQIAIYQKGPVHINVPFDEPLYETVSELKSFDFLNVTSSVVEKSKLVLDCARTDIETNYENLAKIWNASTKKMILVGCHFPDVQLQAVVNNFSRDDSVIVMTETTSNICIEKQINAIDKVIFSLENEALKALQPSVLVTLGGMIVSKKIKQFLRKYQPTHHWHIDEQKTMNTFHCLSEFVQKKPAEFLTELSLEISNVDSLYQQEWLQLKAEKSEKHQKYLQKTVHSDLKVFEQILENIPPNCQLQLGNSSVVRYAQLFDVSKMLHVFCNRGTSGIEGSTSTAIGAALASERQTVFITGDLSFFYDSNALWNNYIPKNFRIIILNNFGGGIFRFISGPKSTNALDYFETPHQLTAEHLAKMYSFNYESVSETEDLQTALNDFYTTSEKPKILEIFTDKEINEKILKEYFAYLK